MQAKESLPLLHDKFLLQLPLQLCAFMKFYDLSRLNSYVIFAINVPVHSSSIIQIH
jgi:hypothetical protein